MKDINYRNVRASPPRVSKLSDLENDLNLMTTQEVSQMISDMTVVTSVNGLTGAVSIEVPPQVQTDWNASVGTASILNKPTLATVATSGSYNDLSNRPSIPTVKRTLAFMGTTDASGNYSVTYSSPFALIPHVQPQLQAGTPNQVVRITSSTISGFTVNVTNRASVTVLTLEVLAATTTPVTGASVSVLVTER